MPKKLPPLEPLFLTKDKILEIKNEIRVIDKEILPEIRKRLAAAYEDGDIPENNPYLTANDDLQDALRRRNELRHLLSRVKLFKPHKERENIHLGSNVHISINGTESKTITLVSSEEAEPSIGKYSVDSPIGKALLGSFPGEAVYAETPLGVITIHVLKS